MTKKCVQIHLMPGARDRAARATAVAMRKAGERVPADFLLEFAGPHFKDVTQVGYFGSTVDVHLQDGTIYVYPLHQVARVKIYAVE